MSVVYDTTSNRSVLQLLEEFEQGVDVIGRRRRLTEHALESVIQPAAFDELLYWLSEAHVGSISRSPRLPITTYYADRCADHARKGYLLNDELIRGIPYV